MSEHDDHCEENSEACGCQSRRELTALLVSAEAYGEKERRHFEWWFKRAIELQDERDTLKAAIASAEDKYRAEYAIVDRVWKALGISTYEEAKGDSIDWIVRDLRTERDTLKAEREKDAEMLAWWDKRSRWYQGELARLKAVVEQARGFLLYSPLISCGRCCKGEPCVCVPSCKSRS